MPSGRWAVAVSGGADSVALATLTAGRGAVVLAHLNHQRRGDDSDADAAFVVDLGRSLGVATAVATLADVERAAPPTEVNPSARYRAARLAFFADVVRRHECDGVLVAHHADDQAETVLLRLLRGRGVSGLGGMAADTRVGDLRVVRPLLGVRRDVLRGHLRRTGQAWREDASNASCDYRRNVARRLLAANPHWTPLLLGLADASGELKRRLSVAAPLAEAFAVRDLPAAPAAREWAVRQWLVARGAPADRVSPAVCARLVDQATNVAAPPRRHYPGRLLVRRRAGRIDVIGPVPLQSPPDHGQETTRAQDL